MTDEQAERHYVLGYKAAIDGLLHHLLREAGPGNAELWRLERNATVAKLRWICRDYGDNDWPDNLNLSDVIEKHLYRHLGDPGQ